MDSYSEQELITAISNNDVGKYEALIQGASSINSNILLNIMVLSSNADGFRAVLNHSSVNPFNNDNYLITMVINHNLPTGYLAIILEHSMNQLTADHYRSFISLCNHSQEKKDLLQSYLE